MEQKLKQSPVSLCSIIFLSSVSRWLNVGSAKALEIQDKGSSENIKGSSGILNQTSSRHSTGHRKKGSANSTDVSYPTGWKQFGVNLSKPMTLHK